MKAFLLILTLGWFVQGFSQQEYFVFLQAESRQPFYVRMGEKTYSSSSTGYLILSKLKDSAYALTVGFPQNQFPEQEFPVRINKKDRGLELKNLGEKGWALFDLQTMELISPAKPAGAGTGGASYNLIKKNDDFARLMAGVVNDTAVLYTVVMEEKKAPVLVSKDTASTGLAAIQKKTEPETKTEPEKKTGAEKAPDIKKTEPEVIADTKKPEPVDSSALVQKQHGELVPDPRKQEQSADSLKTQQAITKKTDSETTKKTEKETVIPKKTGQDPIQDSVLNPPALPVIMVVRQYATDSGYHMVIVDETKDSISLFIPADAPQPKHDTAAQIIEPPHQNNVDTPNNNALVDTLKKETRLVLVNSDCRSFATANDVDKLRVKLIAEKDSDGKIAAAKKIFKTKCFSAQQVKALSELFPYDEQKYKFLEAAYPFVSDTSNFKGLVSLLSDPIYIQRFRKLVRLD